MGTELVWKCMNEKCSNYGLELSEKFRPEPLEQMQAIQDGNLDQVSKRAAFSNIFDGRICSICKLEMTLVESR